MSQSRSKSVLSAPPANTELASIASKLGNWSRPWRSQYGWTLRPLALAMAIRLLVFVTGVAGARLIGSKVFSGVLKTWLQKDAIWYINIASKGYFYQNGVPISANFFPLYRFEYLDPPACHRALHDERLLSASRDDSLMGSISSGLRAPVPSGC